MGNTLPKVNSYTDESGQDTGGKTFVVATVIIHGKNLNEAEQHLLSIEIKSNKNRKWYFSSNKKREQYLELLLKEKIFSKVTVYYSLYKNKLDYTRLVGSHIAKVIINHCGSRQYISKIFMDKVNRSTMIEISKEIKSFHVRYKKIRGITEESSIYIRLADAICGLIRDMKNKNIPESYKEVYSKLVEI